MKKLTIILVFIFIIYLIYSLFYINKLNYVLITDNLFNNKYLTNIIDYKNINSFNDYYKTSSIKKLYQDISNNRTIRVDNTDYYLKKVLRESDILIISVGMEELSNNFDKYNMENNYNYFNNLYPNIERLIKEIKKYAYGKIIFLGYYNPTNYYDSSIDSFFYKINDKLNNLMLNNNIIYIDIYKVK